MSNFTTVYDRIRTELATLYPSKTELPYPYFLEGNPFGFLVDGYGLVVNESILGELNEFCSSAVKHNISIVLTREVVRMEGDVEPMHTQTKTLIEDLVSLRVKFLENEQLTIGSAIQAVNFVGMSPVIFINGDKSDIISASITFSFELSELI